MAPKLMVISTLSTAIVVYVMVCWLHPFARHRRCRGTGARPALIGKKLKPCRRCQGSGLVLRHGRRAYNLLSHAVRDATTARTSGDRP